MKNWLVFEQQRDAYILDGVSRSQAIRLAKKDCRNNPYDKYIKERNEKAFRDLEIMEGGRKRNTFANSRAMYELKNKLSCSKDMVGIVLVAFLVIIPLIVWGLFVNTAIAYCGWNFIFNPIFGVSVITFKDAIAIGVALLIISEILKALLKSKAS